MRKREPRIPSHYYDKRRQLSDIVHNNAFSMPLRGKEDSRAQAIAVHLHEKLYVHGVRGIIGRRTMNKLFPVL